MIISSRKIPPTTAMRRVPSATSTPTLSMNSADFAAKYGFRQFLDSPLPSPALPSIIPRHGKKPNPHRFRKSLRLLFRVSVWCCGFLVLYLLGLRLIHSAALPAGHSVLMANPENEALLKEPTAVVVIDRKGKPKWTVAIPPQLAFPLRPSQYATICHQSDQIRKSKSPAGAGDHPRYYSKDPNFMDIAEAEHDLLLSTRHKNIELKSSGLVGIDVSQENLGQKKMKICERSLTYVLESVDAGLGLTLMGLWMSYGLAEKEGRAFFIDDSNWAYGKYTTFFKTPPMPSCLPAPANHRVPCPHHARHLVVSAATTAWTFGNTFTEKFQSSHKPGHLSQEPIFSLLRAGHDALFHLSAPDAEYLSIRTSELRSKIHSQGGLSVGLHIRHGDCHPWEFQYQKSYIPLSAYMHAAHSMLTDTLSSTIPVSSTLIAASKILLASDDPDVYDSPELQLALRAQSQILLASKSTLDAVQGSPISTSISKASNANKKFVEGNVGWEGGFFSDVFWGLGKPAAGSVAAMGVRMERQSPGELSSRLRELVARAYLLDLKVVGSADGVVCGASSVACRLLGVMVGWEGVVNGRWRNVDGGYGWVSFV